MLLDRLEGLIDRMVVGLPRAEIDERVRQVGLLTNEVVARMNVIRPRVAASMAKQ